MPDSELSGWYVDQSTNRGNNGNTTNLRSSSRSRAKRPSIPIHPTARDSTGESTNITDGDHLRCDNTDQANGWAKKSLGATQPIFWVTPRLPPTTLYLDYQHITRDHVILKDKDVEQSERSPRDKDNDKGKGKPKWWGMGL